MTNLHRRIAFTFLLHALWVPFLVVRVAAIGFERTYREFNMKLPVVTVWLMSGGFMLLLGIMGICLLADVPLLLMLQRHHAQRRLWIFLMIVVPLALAAFATLAAGLPMVTLIETLEK